MEHLIRFKSLSGNMSNNGIKQMVISLMDQEDGVSDVMDAFWSHSYTQYKANDARFVHKINDIAKIQLNVKKNDDENDENRSDADIIKLSVQNDDDNNGNRSGEDDQRSQQRENGMSIVALPDTMINNVGTFLDWADVFRMEHVNRKFFVSLRFPFPALTSMPNFNFCGWITPYITYCEAAGLPINFDRFRGISELCIDGGEIETHASLFGNAFKSVSDMRIDNVRDPTMQAMHSIFNPDVIIISRLYCCIDATGTGADAFQFKNILSQLRNLQFLQIDCDGEPSDRYTSDFESLMEHGCLPNLIHLNSGFSARVNRTILDTSASKVQSFSIRYNSGETFYDDMVLYSQCQQLQNLREFDFCSTPSDLIRYLNEYGWSRMQNLKRVVCRFKYEDAQANANVITACIDGIFKNVSLECIKFRLPILPADIFLQILESLEIALLKYNRQRLTLRLSLKLHHYSVSLLRLVNSMKTSVSSGFGLVLETRSAHTLQARDVLQALTNTVDVEYEKFGHVYIHTKGYSRQEWLSV